MSNDGGGFRWFSGIIATIISGVVVYYLTEGRNPQPPQPNSEPSRISQRTPPSPPKPTPQVTPSRPTPQVTLPPTKPTPPVTITPRPTPQPSPNAEKVGWIWTLFGTLLGVFVLMVMGVVWFGGVAFVLLGVLWGVKWLGDWILGGEDK